MYLGNRKSWMVAVDNGIVASVSHTHPVSQAPVDDVINHVEHSVSTSNVFFADHVPAEWIESESTTLAEHKETVNAG